MIFQEGQNRHIRVNCGQHGSMESRALARGMMQFIRSGSDFTVAAPCWSTELRRSASVHDLPHSVRPMPRADAKFYGRL
jgi:hypothetical protein